MFAAIFRGFFLLGILSFYSMSLWKMIDSYFKDQFQRYLEAEYKRNPKMRVDFQMLTTVDKSNNLNTDTQEQSNQFLKDCIGEACSIAQTDFEMQRTNNSESNNEKKKEHKEEAKNEDEDKVPLQKWYDNNSGAKLPNTLKESLNNIKEIRDAVLVFEVKEMKQLTSYQEVAYKKKVIMKNKQNNGRSKRNRRWSIGFGISVKSECAVFNSKKKLLEGIRGRTFTNDSFNSVMWKQIVIEDKSDWHFAECAGENSRSIRGRKGQEEEETIASISLADLPYKPLIDIYDLQILSQEEFCPLTLDDDSSCEEERVWP